MQVTGANPFNEAHTGRVSMCKSAQAGGWGPSNSVDRGWVVVLGFERVVPPRVAMKHQDLPRTPRSHTADHVLHRAPRLSYDTFKAQNNDPSCISSCRIKIPASTRCGRHQGLMRGEVGVSCDLFQGGPGLNGKLQVLRQIWHRVSLEISSKHTLGFSRSILMEASRRIMSRRYRGSPNT